MKVTYAILFFLLPFPALFLLRDRLEPKSEPIPIETPVEEEAFCPCTVTQGTFSSPLPFLSGNVPVANFYGYGIPAGSSANTGLEISETFVLMLYEDTSTGEVSVVFIADIINDGTGGQMGVTFNCMPSGSFIAVADDPGELIGSAPTFTGNFNWQGCCTDGGAISGVGCGYSFTINPNIINGINTFALVHGTQANPTYIPMPNLNCPITINCGGPVCCLESFEFSAVTQNASCANSANGSIDLSTNCATAPTFQWSNGQTTQDISGLVPGVYSVTITSDGCTQTGNYTIGFNSAAPTPAITGPTSFCAGQTAVLGVNGSFTSYLWSNGQQTPSIAISSGGTYSVTVTNAAGCSGSASTTVTMNPSPTPNITGPTSVCFGQQIMLSAGAGYSSYIWSTGATTPVIFVTNPGGYSVTVTNIFGCQGVDVAVVQPLLGPVPNITGPSSTCEGQAITLGAGGVFSGYNWSTGAATPTINVSSPGTYSITVTASNGCTGSDATTITENPADSVFTYITSCNPQDTGVFTQTISNQFGCDSVLIQTVSYSESDTTLIFSGSCQLQDTGVVSQTFTNQFGCDSLVIETVSLLPSDTLFLSSGSCNPQDTGSFIFNYINQYGCDSVEFETVSLLPTDSVFLFSTDCHPQDTGVFVQTFLNQFGCDSVEISTVSFSEADTTYIFSASCNPLDTGIYVQTILDQGACDSIVIDTRSLLPSDTVFLFSASCVPQDTGVFYNSFINQFGCDSTTIEAVTLLLSDSTYLFSESCNPLDTGVFVSTLINQNGCDSVLILSVGFNESDTTYLFSQSCFPQDTGIFLTSLTNQYGCDSTVFEAVSLLPTDTLYLTSASCFPQDTGLFVFNYTNQYGCDSIEIETVSLLPTDTVYLTSASCFPQDTGLFVFNYTNQYGCDSIEIEAVNLLPTDTVYLTSASCFPQDTGLFVFNYTNQYGCDSTEIETVSLLPTDTVYLTSASCFPQDTGMFVFSYTNQYGCDSTEIETVSLLPTDTVYLTSASCFPQDTGLFVFSYTNQYGCDSIEIETVSLLPTDTMYLTSASCFPQDTGLFVFNYTNQYGCDSIEIETVSLLPTDTVYLTSASCFPQDTGLFVFNYTNQYGCDSIEIETVSLLPTDTLYFFGTTCDPLEVGIYPSLYTNQYGCDSLEVLEVTLLPLDSCALTVGAELTDAFCFGNSDGSIALSITGGNVPIQCDWVSQDGTLSGTLNLLQFGDLLVIQGLPAGTYTVHLTDPNGLEWEQDFTIDEPPLLTASIAITSDYFGYDVSCAGGADGSILGSATGGTGPYGYAWSTGQTGPALNGLSAGTYSLTATDSNGCTAVANQLLDEPASLSASLEVKKADCLEGNRISVTAVTGGIPPYLISIDGGPFSGQLQFDDLAPGAHEISIEDAVACAWSQDIQLPELPVYWADLGPDTSILLGESATIFLETNLAPIDTIIWDPLPTDVSCNNCFSIQVAPIQSEGYSVFVRDTSGCEATDTIFIGVYREKDFFVPNVISPNFDGINDKFVVYAGRSVRQIQEMVIFDRWGGTVFRQTNFPPNDPAYGWDGRRDEVPVTEGVYVYQFVVEYVDGLTLLVAGDVAVVR
ncbi:MAG: gliding motility-associated C-terminal domain-containing protein [Saprospirales bacterium]|nr:gliding motility-associated C-terminal domain-containing protein [Saprospirales bacterium]